VGDRKSKSYVKSVALCSGPSLAVCDKKRNDKICPSTHCVKAHVFVVETAYGACTRGACLVSEEIRRVWCLQALYFGGNCWDREDRAARCLGWLKPVTGAINRPVMPAHLGNHAEALRSSVVDVELIKAVVSGWALPCGQMFFQRSFHVQTKQVAVTA